MILRSCSGETEFELCLEGYQFPGNDYDGWDANWLMVSIRVVCPAGSWARTDPCLTTFEVHELARWLGGHALQQDTAPRLDFLEPNLSFEVAGRDAQGCDLRIGFAAECHPPRTVAGSDGFEFIVPFRVRLAELREAANQLCRELQAYAVRALHPGSVPLCREI